MSSPSISFSISRQWRDCKLTQSCGLTPKKNPNRAVASIAIRRLPRTTSLIQHPRQDEPPFRVTPSRTCRAHPSSRSQRLQESAHSRVPGPGDPAGRRYPDDRIGGRGSTGLHSAQRPGCDHLGGTPLGEHTLRYPRLPANAARPRTSSRARDTGKIPVVQHSTPKKPLSGPKTALSAAQPGPPSTKHGFRDTAHSHHPFSPTHPCRCSRFVHHRKHRQPASRTYPPSSEN